MQALLHSVPPTMQQVPPDPHLCRSLLDTHSKSGSVSCGVLLPPPGSWYAQGSVCAPQESVSPVLCKFWWLCGRVNADLLQEGLCHTRSAAPRAPAPAAVHCRPIPPQDTLRHSSGSVSVGSLGPSVHKFCLIPVCTRTQRPHRD